MEKVINKNKRRQKKKELATQRDAERQTIKNKD
jgi:hypothetical protein